jgi:hypothetical protein
MEWVTERATVTARATVREAASISRRFLRRRKQRVGMPEPKQISD